jgi:hypothetical protein
VSTPALQLRHSSAPWPHSCFVRETRVDQGGTSNSPFPGRDFVSPRGGGLVDPPHFLGAQKRAGSGANLCSWPCLAPHHSPPPPPAQGRAGEGVVLPAGAERVHREKPPYSNESAHSAAARRMITRGGGGKGGLGRGRRVRRPRGPGVPACLAANRTLSAVTEAGGSRWPSPAQATRRVTRKHGAAPLPRPPRAPASHFLPPARLLQF